MVAAEGSSTLQYIQAVVFDWAGTLVDCGSCGPVQAFVESFAAHGVQVTTAEARAPMGMGKREHVAAMLAMPRIAGRSQTSPRRCTGRMALTRRSPARARASARVSGVIRPEWGSTSANTTSAPT